MRHGDDVSPLASRCEQGRCRLWNSRVIPRIVAVASIAVLYALARLPVPPEGVRAEARRFRFESVPLPVLTASQRSIRPVRPSLRHIAQWISSVGAAVALHDLDGDGLSNDVLYVDVRSDEVVVAPAPGTPKRYSPFNLLDARGCKPIAASAPMGVLPADVDEDGYTDVVVYYWGRSPLLYLRRERMPLAPNAFDCQEIITPREEWYTNAATFADVDGDGHADLVIGNYFREGSGVLDPHSRSAEMEMQDSMSRAFNGGVNRLLLHSSDNRPIFRDVRGVFPEEIARGWTLAIGAQDLDGDLLPEIYLANDFGPDRLLHNLSTPGQPRFAPIEGSRGFFDPKSKVLGHDSFKGMGVDFADLNHDGVLDVLVSNITDAYALEESNLLFISSSGTLDYHDRGETLGVSRSGWGWDVRFGDFDGDGVPEIVQATGFVRGEVNRWPELHELAMTNDDLLHRAGAWPRFEAGTDLSGNDRNPFFVRARDGRYYDVAEQLDIPAGMISRGIATGDVDGDGRLDFVVANQWETSRFFHNVGAARSRTLELHLRLPVQPQAQTKIAAGTVADARATDAIGATARVTPLDSTSPRAMAQVDGGNGHSGKRAAELHFGLGNASAAQVELRWRDRSGTRRQTTMRLSAGIWTIFLANGEV